VKKNYSATMRGTLNGQSVFSEGNGSYDSTTGLISGIYTYSRIPNSIDLKIFNSVKVTGYPSVCELHNNIENPFSNGSYSYERFIDFGSHGSVWYSAKCAHKNTNNEDDISLTSFFQIDGMLSLPKLLKTEEVLETWVPAGNGRVDGQFTIAWLAEDGHYVCGKARTQYVLPAGRDLDGLHFRHLRLTNPESSSESVLNIVQASSLRRSLTM
jgi:hypothetical protein